jgi:ubiquitin-like 1-activating enzyme E1 A
MSTLMLMVLLMAMEEVRKCGTLTTRHLAQHSRQFFPPTMAIVGGLLSQDILRAISRKDKPIVNLLVVDSIGGSGVAHRWAMADAVDA